jgi:hypothetical protein
MWDGSFASGFLEPTVTRRLHGRARTIPGRHAGDVHLTLVGCRSSALR